MASDIYAAVKFSDGTIASLVASGVSNRTATELTTGGTGLNQVASVSIGQAYSGKRAVAAMVNVVKDATNIAAGTADAFCYAYFLGPDGKIMCLAQGGGAASTGFEPLAKPIVMQTGVTFVAASSNAGDGVNQASLAVYCTDGTADVFTALAVADVKTSMQNKDGSTIGQALNGRVIQKAYATYGGSKGVNEDGAGVQYFYVESADGQLKMLFPPAYGAGQSAVPYIPGYGTRILQNDSLSVMGTT